MTNEVSMEGLSIAPSVVETIISVAASDVEGVACLGSYSTSGLRSMLAAKPSTSGIDVDVEDDGGLHVSLHVEVYNGYVLPDLAAELRRAIAESLKTQAGIEVSAIDVYVDGIRFKS